VILLDTSGLLAAIDAAQHRHTDAAASLVAAQPPLLLSPFVLAARHGTRDVLTLDERHFRVLTVGGEPLRLLPADA
jgi:predicted nucleic acid-binding protein